jgi:hypothetical protein
MRNRSRLCDHTALSPAPVDPLLAKQQPAEGKELWAVCSPATLVTAFTREPGIPRYRDG